MNPRKAVAHAVDRCNVRLVEWWLDHEGAVRPEAAEVPSGPPPGAPVLERERDGGQLWTTPGSDWRAERRGRDAAGALVLLHGWLSGPIQFAYYRWLTSSVARYAEVWLPRLPEHGARASERARSGELCLSENLELTAAQLARGVAETRWLLAWLRERHRRVVLWGVSLGGWVAALASASEPNDGLVLWAPVLDPTRTLRESELGRLIGRRMDPSALERWLEREDVDLAPIAGLDRWAGTRMLVVGGRYDDVSPPDLLERAAVRTGAELEILPDGHISLLASRRARRRSLEFVRARLAPDAD